MILINLRNKVKKYGDIIFRYGNGVGVPPFLQEETGNRKPNQYTEQHRLPYNRLYYSLFGVVHERTKPNERTREIYSSSTRSIDKRVVRAMVLLVYISPGFKLSVGFCLGGDG